MEAPVTSDAPEASRLIVTFYEEAIVDERASKGWQEERYNMDTGEMKIIRHPGAGHDVFKDVTFIEIRIPGNLKEIRRREVRPSDFQRFPQEWAHYKSTKENRVHGTPIETLPFLTKGQALEWKGMGFQTAEQIRDTSDGDGQKFMGFQDMKQKVSNFLAALAGHAPVLKLEAEVKTREQENAALRAQIAELTKAIEKRK